MLLFSIITLLFSRSGSDLVYIYPDFKTAFRGSFDEKGQMIETKQVDIIGLRIQEFGGIMELQFSKPFGPIFKVSILPTFYVRLFLYKSFARSFFLLTF